MGMLQFMTAVCTEDFYLNLRWELHGSPVLWFFQSQDARAGDPFCCVTKRLSTMPRGREPKSAQSVTVVVLWGDVDEPPRRDLSIGLLVIMVLQV